MEDKLQPQAKNKFNLFGDILKDKYTDIHYAGEGGFCMVLYGKNIFSGRKEAIKIIDLYEMERKGCENGIKREIEILDEISHPNIVEYYNSFQIKSKETEYLFIVMEYCPKSLRNVLSECPGGIPKKQAMKYLVQILEAVLYLHLIGILHKDIKLDNFLLDKEDNIKIADFNISKKLIDKRSTVEGRIRGTIRYLSPERILHSEANELDDMWAIGCAYYELLEGIGPFDYPRSNRWLMYENICKIIHHPYKNCEQEDIDLLEQIFKTNDNRISVYKATQLLNIDLRRSTLDALHKQTFSRMKTTVSFPRRDNYKEGEESKDLIEESLDNLEESEDFERESNFEYKVTRKPTHKSSPRLSQNDKLHIVRECEEKITELEKIKERVKEGHEFKANKGHRPKVTKALSLEAIFKKCPEDEIKTNITNWNCTCGYKTFPKIGVHESPNICPNAQKILISHQEEIDGIRSLVDYLIGPVLEIA